MGNERQTKKKKTYGKRKKTHGNKKNLKAKRKRLTVKEITSRSRGAFSCACSVNFSLKWGTAAMRLRRFFRFPWVLFFLPWVFFYFCFFIISIIIIIFFFFCREVLPFAVSLFLLPRSYYFFRDSCGPPCISFIKKQRIKTRQFHTYEERSLFR